MVNDDRRERTGLEMRESSLPVPVGLVARRIYLIRGQRVMIGLDPGGTL
jgi:hypothetical protein